MFKLQFADIIILLTSVNSQLVFDLPFSYELFRAEGQPEVTLMTDIGRIPSFSSATPVFHSGGNWSLFKEDGKWVIPVCFPPDADPWLVAKFSSDYCKGEILVNNQMIEKPSFYPLAYPLDELIIINLLARGRGVELHACAVAVEHFGKGLLFIGTSGAGKSTLSRLWRGYQDITLLSDDRVIVRQKDGVFWIYGTPWHGDAQAVSSRSVPLDRIFVLQHAPQNEAIPLKPVEAAARLLVRSFPTFWDASGMAFTLQFLDELSQEVPCYDFGFVPDRSAIDYLRQQVST